MALDAAYTHLGADPLDVDRYPQQTHDPDNWRESTAPPEPVKLDGVTGRVQEYSGNTDQYKEYATTHRLLLVGMKVIKSNIPLIAGNIDGTQPADVLNHQGRRYQIVSSSDNRDSVLPHCSAVGMEIQSTEGGRA